MDQFEIIRYDSSLKHEWDAFVDLSKNGTFILKRDYIEYHADRFSDHSYVIRKKSSTYALLPACKIGNKIFSHAGLTYGGLIMNDKCTSGEVLLLFFKLKRLLSDEGFEQWIYKPTPHIYHKLPSEEDLYAIFRLNASLYIRNVSESLPLPPEFQFRKLRKRGIAKAIKNDIVINCESDFGPFWRILEGNLADKYNAKPVHSLAEIKSLAASFPHNIKLFTAKKDLDTVAGVVCYICNDTVHCQYISDSSLGKQTGALDLLFDYLINNYFADKKYFDFGTSNEAEGQYLNENLTFFKEGFGARAICYDSYLIPL